MPTATDDVAVLDPGTPGLQNLTPEVDRPNTFVGSVKIYGGTITLKNSLRVWAYHQAGGVVTGPGDLIIGEKGYGSSWFGGTMRGPGSTRVTAPQFSIRADTGRELLVRKAELDYRKLEFERGTNVFWDGGNIYLKKNASIVNRGNWRVTGDAKAIIGVIEPGAAPGDGRQNAVNNYGFLWTMRFGKRLYLN